MSTSTSNIVTVLYITSIFKSTALQYNFVRKNTKMLKIYVLNENSLLLLH